MGGPCPPVAPQHVYKWAYVGGKWIQVEQETTPNGNGTSGCGPGVAPANQPLARGEVKTRPEEYDPYGWKKADKSDTSRTIAINVSKLDGGDARMNIVIRDGDVIIIPLLERGEFYVMGEVARPGVYDLTGRKVTVKMALAAAGTSCAGLAGELDPRPPRGRRAGADHPAEPGGDHPRRRAGPVPQAQRRACGWHEYLRAFLPSCGTPSG